MKKEYKRTSNAMSNKEFAENLGKAYKHKKKKSSNPLDALMGGGAKKRQPMSPVMPMQNQMAQSPQGPQAQQPMMKKSKMKSAKKKSSTKKKVSYVKQETSECKSCKTSHKPGKHEKKQKHSASAIKGVRKFVDEEANEKDKSSVKKKR